MDSQFMVAVVLIVRHGPICLPSPCGGVLDQATLLPRGQAVLPSYSGKPNLTSRSVAEQPRKLREYPMDWGKKSTTLTTGSTRASA